MKRMHVHVSVPNIDNAIGFYLALFATKPTVVKDDYAKWMLDDPRMNFAISTRGPNLASTTLASRSRAKANCKKSMGGFAKRAATSLKKARLLVVMLSPKNLGSMIRQASRGKPSSRPVKVFTTAIALKKALALQTLKLAADQIAASQPQGRSLRQPRLAARRSHGRQTLQRVIPLHRQFGSLDHC